MFSPSSPDKSSRKIVTTADEEIIAKICQRRGYHDGLLRNLIDQKRVDVALLDSAVVEFTFLANGQIVQVCEVDANSNLYVKVTSQEPWLWEGTRDGGGSLLVATPIDLLEVSATAIGLINQLESALAGVPSNEITTLVCVGEIQNSAVIAQPCARERSLIRDMGKLNRVSVYFASPAPYDDWSQCRDAAASGSEPLAVKAIEELGDASSQLMKRNVKLGIMGGIEIRFPRKRKRR